MMHAKIPMPKGSCHFMFMSVSPYFYDFHDTALSARTAATPARSCFRRGHLIQVFEADASSGRIAR
jgi:hypothetical protein